MTGPGPSRPGDAAREALRAARERAEAERDGTAGPAQAAPPEADSGTAREPRHPAETGTQQPDGCEPRPGDRARAALRSAAVRGDDTDEPPADADVPAPDKTPQTGSGETQETDSGENQKTRSGETQEPGSGETAETGSGESAETGTGETAKARRPGDAAREALRAARREALREKTPEPRHGRHTSARPGKRASDTSSTAGQEHRPPRAKAAQDMRHYLANAFRMPTWVDIPAEPEEPSGDTPSTAQPPSPPAPEAPASASQAPASASPPSASDASKTPPTTGSSETSTWASAYAAAVSSASSARPADQAPSASKAPASEAPAPMAPASETKVFEALAFEDPVPEPSAPRLPSTMATPHRDGELRRTFPALVTREAAGSDAAFAGTWWGNAWVEALEEGALDPKRLVRGRGYADQGHVDAITVTPGLVLAYVRGSRPRPYRVQVRVRTLDDEDWARFLDAAVDRPGHIAALLDKELPHSLADCGVPLLPGPGDLAPHCSCPDTGHPCKHAAALCYQTARLLDADPFVLLLLRGRGEKSLLDALSRRSAARAARAARERQPEALPGVRATDAFAERELPRLPPPLPVPPHPEQPPAYPAAPGGPDPFALDQLATDAAARAHALLGTGRDPVGELSLWQDAVRLAAARPGSGLTAATRTLYATLATAVHRTQADLARAVAAWRQGGLEGLAVLEEPWDPPAGRFDRARPLLLAADLPAFRPWRNHLTHPLGHVQLRLGRDGLWYAYESEPGQEDWWPRGTPDLDPVGALTGLGTPDDV
ncbi:SWIM zinc finger family protein [Streptomyces sp. NPDC048362]|uniref:SWIM zinc finger family protein n=1 Tax=Streptomyces sp. NPDC048362 TaxID=3365539 RepID=UPI0037128131